MPGPIQTYPIRRFIGGRNSTVSEPLIKEDESPNDLNVDSRPIGVLTKRAGWQRYIDTAFGSGPSAVTGLHKLYRKLGDNFLLVYVAPTLYSTDNSGTRIALKNDFTELTFMDFVTMKDFAYGTNFADEVIRTNGSTLDLAELPRPTNSGNGASPGATGSGLLDAGLYFYRVRAYFGEAIGESGWERNDITVDGQDAKEWTYRASPGTFSTPDDGSNSLILNATEMPTGATHMRIYRTQATDPEAIPYDSVTGLPDTDAVLALPYYFLDEIALADLPKTYTDTKADAGLGYLADPDPLFTPKARYIAKHGNRLWLANTEPRWEDKIPETQGQYFFKVGPTEPNRVYWSDLYVPGNIMGFVEVFPDDGDVITGIRSLGPNLYVYKRRHIYVILGTSPDDFIVRLVEEGKGCMAPRTLDTYHERHIFLAEDGVYLFDGVDTEEVSAKIRADLLAIPQENRAMASAVIHQNRYYLCLAEIE